METAAIVFERPGEIGLERISLKAPKAGDVVVETLWSGISTGTEKMFFEGTMPPFPGLGYPLVPGYESVGRVIDSQDSATFQNGDLVFIPGANCYESAAGLFGASAQTLIVEDARLIAIPEYLARNGVLLALAATAHHAVMRAAAPANVVIGHGVLGRLIARVNQAVHGVSATVWETNPARRDGANSYTVIAPEDDDAKQHACIIDASGSVPVLDPAVAKLAKGGMLVLAGFYHERVAFDFPAAFMREIDISIAAEFKPHDVARVLHLIDENRLSLDRLISHHTHCDNPAETYRTAFNDPDCLKMVIDWRNEQ